MPLSYEALEIKELEHNLEKKLAYPQIENKYMPMGTWNKHKF